MNIVKRYTYIFIVTVVALWGFSWWVMEQNPDVLDSKPHNLTQERHQGMVVQLPPQNYYEVCRELTKTERWKYNYQSSESLSFNIHFHEGGSDYYPRKTENIKVGRGEYKPEAARVYCLMWRNSGETSLELNFEHEVIH